METRNEEFRKRFGTRMEEAVRNDPCLTTGEDSFDWDPRHPVLPNEDPGDLFFGVRVVAESRFWRGPRDSDRYYVTTGLLWQHEFNRFLEWVLRLQEPDGKGTPLTHELERVRDVLLEVAEEMDSNEISVEEARFLEERLMGFHARVAEGFRARLLGSVGKAES